MKEKYEQYLKQSEQVAQELGRVPTVTFEEWLRLQEYCESMVKEEIEYMIKTALNGEEYNPPAGETDFDRRAREYTREIAAEWCSNVKEKFINEFTMAAADENSKTME